jgi:3-hydroxyacyl-CoA dehydrogenase
MAEIKTIGICGSGVMGSQLATFLAGAGFDVLLFDLNQELSEKGLAAALKARPPAIYHKRFARRVTPCNYDDHLDRFAECDWVIEAIAERLDWKTSLYARIQPHLKPEAILSSNTSGLALADLVAGLDPQLRRRFLITHFFNPPRYMQLVEVIPTTETDPDVLQWMAGFVSERLGKGVVYAKDTPDFIANRIGIFGMMLTLKLAQQMKLTVEQVDALTGPVMGRPKSATFRTADLVGLDVMSAVAQTAYDQCPDDEQRDMFKTPPLLAELLERKHLGQKTGAGFYKKQGKDILVLDFESLEYRPKIKPRMDGIGVARRNADLGQMIHALVYNPDSAGEFAWEMTIQTLIYSANRIGEIADDIVNVDRAMRWGFGWELGPFEVWDAIGVEKSANRLVRDGRPVPEMVTRLLEDGRDSFYARDSQGGQSYFDMAAGAMQTVPVEDGVVILDDEKARGRELLRNWSASLVDIGDGVGCIEFHSALQRNLNPIDGAILDMIQQSLVVAGERGLKGLIITASGAHFCAGANLALLLGLAKAGDFERLESVSREYQMLTQAIKYAPFPVVAAPFSMCLGGGFEITAPCRSIVALAELYCGAVEVGVGLIPGAGGNLRVLSHFCERLPWRKFGPMPAVQKAFETIAFAKVSGSAHEAVEMGYLRENEPIVLSRHHQIGRAKQEVLRLAEEYLPPEPAELILPGEGGRLAIESTVDGFVRAGAVTEHDALIVKKLAIVLTGGDRADGIHPVDEQYLLDIEREVFVSLAGEPRSQDRMAHMLTKGKPLRN